MKLPQFLSHLLLIAGLAVAAAGNLFAQDPAAETLQQKVTLPNQIDPVTLPEGTSNADLGEIGVMQKFPKPAMFTASTSQQFFYSDNVFYTDAKPLGSAAYLGSYTASFVPYSLRDWTPRISLQYNMVRYQREPAADFDNENLALSNQYIFSEDRTWSWTAAIDLSRFTAPHINDNEFYKEVIYDSQITHVWQLEKEMPLFFVTTYDLGYHETSPNIYNRLDNALDLSLVYYPMPEVSLRPYVRPAARTYFMDAAYGRDRYDLNISAGLDVTWQPCKYFSLSSDVSHTDDFSNVKGLNYSDTIPGISVTGTIKF